MTHGNENPQEGISSFISIRKVILFIFIGIVIYLIILFYSSIDAVLTAMALIPWWVLPAMLGLSFLNYAIRYVKWQYYLRRIDVNLSHSDSFSVFLAGFTLTTTPGKIGEAVKGIFVNDIDGTPIAKTIPIVVSERVTDLLALIILAMLGFIVGFTAQDQLFLIVILGAGALVGAVVLSQSVFYQKIIKKMTGFGPLKRFQDSCDLIEDTMVRTLSPKPMALTTLVSVPGWFMECVSLWLILSFITATPFFTYASIVLLLQATFIHATASAVGALVFTPGGLGGYEATSYILMWILLALTEGPAGAATMIIRFVTLWFSVLVGFVALGFMMRKNRKKEADSQQA